MRKGSIIVMGLKVAKFGAAVALIALVQPPLWSASHREAPAVTETPKVDNTDTYAFRSYEPGRQDFVTLIANFQPGEDPGSGPNYYTMDPEAIYEIHVDNNGDAVEDLTYQFKFTNTLRNNTGLTLNIGGVNQPIAVRQMGTVDQVDDTELGERETYTVTLVTGPRRTGTRANIANATGGSTTFVKPLDNIGNKTIPNYAAYRAQFINTVNIPGCSTPGRVFAGQSAEYFAVNLGPVFDQVNFVPIQGVADPVYDGGQVFPLGGTAQSQANQELIGKKNVTSLAIEVPIACLRGTGNGVIGVWSTASLPQASIRRPNATFARPTADGGAFTQVSRLGNPLVNELVIGLPQKDLFNASQPRNDAQFATFVTNPTYPAILDGLFRGPVNTGLNLPTTARIDPGFFPRTDLVAVFLTGIQGVNQQSTVTPSEMLRLNMTIPPTPNAQAKVLGPIEGDLAGFPNGRRPFDDVVDIALRVVMGRLCHPVNVGGTPTDLGLCTPAQAPTGRVPYTDAAPNNPLSPFLQSSATGGAFPYLGPPLRGAPLPQNQP
jgi:Domain of unknown function (DUF4331)